MNLAIRDQDWVLDFARFRKYLKEKYNIQKAFLLLDFFMGIKHCILIYKIWFYCCFQTYHGITIRRNKGIVDAELVLHSMIEYPNYDKH